MSSINKSTIKIEDMPPVMAEVYSKSVDYCIENKITHICPDVMTAVILGVPSVSEKFVSCGVDAPKFKNKITELLVAHSEFRGTREVTPSTVSITRGSALIISEVLMQVKFEKESKIDHLSILEMIKEQEGTLLNETLKTIPEVTVHSIFHGGTKTTPATDKEVEELIEEYTTNLNAMVTEGHIDPVIGRDTEVCHIAEILARKKKNNVILIGDAGVGKTAVVEGLAHAIVNGTAPDVLLDKVIYSIEVVSLLAGTKYRGEFEERARNILKGLAAKQNAIIFIDEAHTVMNAGSSSTSGVDLANIMKPMLARSELACICATTHDEYRRTIQKDSAMVRRLQTYTVNEPSEAHVKEIIDQLTPVYENYHGVVYGEETTSDVFALGQRYLSTKRNPDKSIDILDAAGAYAKVSKRSEVETQDIMYVISRMAKIPLETMDEKDTNVFAGIEDRIKAKIFNQDHAINTIIDELAVAKAGLKEDNKPMGAFLLAGVSGTGKSELCRQLAHELSIPLVKIDMSEFQESHSVSKLIGSPPGYAGYDDHNARLIDEIEKTPNCVLLLDEIEKAHPKVLSILLQIMDDAVLTSSHGKVAKFNNVVIVMTSNLGASASVSNSIGYVEVEDGTSDIQTAINDFFTVEFRNRLNAQIIFNTLDHQAMRSITLKEVSALNSKLSSKGITVELSEDSLNQLATDGYDKTMGARPLQRLFSDKIKLPLSRAMVTNKITSNSNVVVSYSNGEYVFS